MIDPIRTCVLIVAVAAFARPDVLPPPPVGMKSVSVSVRVGLADPDGGWIVGRRIVEGDTFQTLAGRELGNAAFVGWVAGLNPGTDPRRLQIDQLVWMPRKGAVGNAAAPLVFVDTGRAGYVAARPFEPAADGRDSATTLVLVRQEHRREFEGCFGSEGFERLAVLEEAGHVRRIAVDGIPGDFVPKDSAIARIDVDAALRTERDGQVRIEIESVRYLAADGGPLEPPPAARRLSDAGAPEFQDQPWWPALLAVGATLVLLFLAVRRARAESAA